jgi:tRNA nucleotidyltransferase/poly(A) polymerase
MEDLQQALYEHRVVRKLAAQFKSTPHALYLVGGCVRDAVAGRNDFSDLDFTTDATPEEIEFLVADLGPLWLAGKRFGTIGVFMDGEKVEITTFRGETYEENSRKPEVVFSTDIMDDLVRRDFTVNSMAIRVDSDEAILIDPFQGAKDLQDKILRTPGNCDATIIEDPLRAVRAVRFAATRGFRLSVTLQTAILKHGPRLEIVATERVMEECRKIFVLGADAVRRAFTLSTQLGINTFMFGALGMRDLDDFDTLEILGSDGNTALALMVCETVQQEEEVNPLLSALTLSNGEKEDIKKIATTAMQLKDMRLVMAMRILRRQVGVDTFTLGVLVGNLAFGLETAQIFAAAGVTYDRRLDASLPVNGEDVMAHLGCEPGPFVGGALKFLEALFCVDPDITRDEMLEALVTNKGAV